MLLGCLVGVVLGRMVWGAVATSVGILPGHVLPVRDVIAAIGASLILGVGAVLWPTRFVSRGRPAAILRAD